MSETTQKREPVTVTDWHHQRVGEAVLAALEDADPELWFDVGVAVATDKRVQRAVLAASERGKLSASEREVMQEDIGAILRALGLGDHARPMSPHEVVQQEILPTIEKIKQEAA